MLTEVCQYLHNWFDRKPDGGYYPKYTGIFTISGGELLDLDGQLASGQYIRIMGSLFNEGVHKYLDEADVLKDESFNGAVWTMGIPPAFIGLVDEIAAWQAKNGSVDSAAMSPFTSESFGGYSYSKGGGTVYADGSTSAVTWQSAYLSRLAPWRKLP